MRLLNYSRAILLLLGTCTMLSTSACLLVPDSGEDQGTEVAIEPALTAPDPDTFVCNPMNGGQTGLPREQGIRGMLYYLDASQPRYNRVADYFTYGTFAQGIDSATGVVTEIALYFNQIFVPTRPFDRGFVTQSGQALQTPQGNTLYEYFAVRHEGRLQVGSKPPGLYQLAVLSDDGAVLSMDFGSGYQTVINNDGNHPTRMGCAVMPVELNAQDKIPYLLDYYQGPRFHISIVLMWRAWPASPSNPGQPATLAEANDAFCGVAGNSFYFNSAVNPPAPSANYNALLARGWEPIAPEHYLLPEENEYNPCNEPAPVISNFQVAAIASTTITLTWTTDRPGTSLVVYRLASNATELITPATGQYSTAHSAVVTGLTPNTDYVVKGRSASTSGLSSDSAPRTVRTRR